jgi:arabinan endo-1,5-alpha-L-arabinosidase
VPLTNVDGRRTWLTSTVAAGVIWLTAVGCSGEGGAPKSSEPERQSSTPSSTPSPVTSTTGAALDRDFPDPTVIRTSEGAYFAYATQTETGSGAVNIQVARSDDLQAWAYLGDALPVKPAWADQTQAYWAPHVVEREKTFYLYYSAIPNDSSGDENCLAVATSPSPEGPFEDVGEPVLCGYEIDPAVFFDPRSNRWLMYWGSAGDIAVQSVADDMVSLRGGGPKTLLLGWSSPVRRPYEHGIEGPFVIYRDGWYYLFYSGDRCCEYPPHYALLVARSRRPDRGFQRIGEVEDRPSSVILSDFDRWEGPGHCSVVTDEENRDWIACHAIDKRQPLLPNKGVRRVMLMLRLVIRNGWPHVSTNDE